MGTPASGKRLEVQQLRAFCYYLDVSTMADDEINVCLENIDCSSEIDQLILIKILVLEWSDMDFVKEIYKEK
mgnify:FL=1